MMAARAGYMRREQDPIGDCGMGINGGARREYLDALALQTKPVQY